MDMQDNSIDWWNIVPIQGTIMCLRELRQNLLHDKISIYSLNFILSNLKHHIAFIYHLYLELEMKLSICNQEKYSFTKETISCNP